MPKLFSKLCFAGLMLVVCEASSGFAEEKPLRIGVLTDLSGAFADLAGYGSVEAIRMAAEEHKMRILDRKIEIISADHQNKADIGAAIARRWFDTEGVDVIADFSNSSVGFALQELARERRKIILLAAGSSDFTGKSCMPTSSQWVYNSYTNGYALARELTRQGLKSWYIVTADYAFGHSFEAEIKKAVLDNGGEVKGTARHPLGTSDFSSFLLGAQSSGAQVIALANAGADTINAVKQAGEFGILPKQVIATPALFNTDIRSLGLERAAGLRFITSAYSDMDEHTRRWSTEFLKRRRTMPSMTHVGMYSAVQHYLKSVEAAGTTDGRAVAQKMQELPVENVFTHQGRVRVDGQMVHDLFFAQVKQPEESGGEWDLFKILYMIPASAAFRPLEESECPLVKATK